MAVPFGEEREMENYYAVEQDSKLRCADMRREVANDYLASLTTTVLPRPIGRTRMALGQLMIRIGTRIAPPAPAQPLTPRPEVG